MKRFTLIMLVLFFPAIVFTQEFKPLLDPTIACSYGNPHNPINFETNKTELVNYYFIVEEMPKPKVSLTKMENLLKENIYFSEKEINENGKIVIQCLVNCQGKAGDFQIISSPSKMTSACNQMLDVFKKDFTEWEAGIQRNKNVDVLIMMVVNIDKEKIKIEYKY